MGGILPSAWVTVTYFFHWLVYGTSESWTSWFLNSVCSLVLIGGGLHWVFFEARKDYQKYKAFLFAFIPAIRSVQAANPSFKTKVVYEQQQELPPEIPQSGLAAAGGAPIPPDQRRR